MEGGVSVEKHYCIANGEEFPTIREGKERGREKERERERGRREREREREGGNHYYCKRVPELSGCGLLCRYGSPSTTAKVINVSYSVLF